MNYLTNYYRNLAEDLEIKVQQLEEALKKALRSKNPEKMANERKRQEIKAVEAARDERDSKRQKEFYMNHPDTPSTKYMQFELEVHRSGEDSANRVRRGHARNIRRLDRKIKNLKDRP
jgi:hypothetical protein